MIKFYDQVPTVYLKASRDFQYLSWLINVVFNSVKHNVDDIYHLPSTKINIATTELLAMTLGFKIKRQYDQRQLESLVGVLPVILKKKGSLEALNLAAMTLSKAVGTDLTAECTIEDNKIKIFLPRTFKDITLFLDILPYIAPAGLTCEISRGKTLKYEISDNYAHKSIFKNDFTTSKELASYYPTDRDQKGYANIIDNEINIGLTTNAQIPTLASGETQNEDLVIKKSEED